MSNETNNNQNDTATRLLEVTDELIFESELSMASALLQTGFDLALLQNNIGLSNTQIVALKDMFKDVVNNHHNAKRKLFSEERQIRSELKIAV